MTNDDVSSKAGSYVEPLSLRRRRLKLSMEIILAIEEELAKRLDTDPETPLEKLHGSFSVEIVKGRFHRIEVAGSTLLTVDLPARRNIA